MNNFNYAATLGEMRRAFRRWPRWWVPARDRVQVPDWARNGDRLGDLARRQDRLLTRGEVVWGALVQANRLMFAPGVGNSPGNMIYSRDPASFARPDILLRAAEDLFAVKGRATTPALQRFSETLADEMERLMAVPVPPELTEGIDSTFTGLLFERRHLPGGVIDRRLLPMLVCSDFDDTMILPKYYWPRSFLFFGRS